jgi:hypothetical protein
VESLYTGTSKTMQFDSLIWAATVFNSGIKVGVKSKDSVCAAQVTYSVFRAKREHGRSIKENSL